MRKFLRKLINWILEPDPPQRREFTPMVQEPSDEEQQLPIEVGSVVVWRNQPPLMTVHSLEPEDDVAICTWKEQGVTHTHTFRISSLKVIKTPNGELNEPGSNS